jgi:hypothetical protein
MVSPAMRPPQPTPPTQPATALRSNARPPRQRLHRELPRRLASGSPPAPERQPRIHSREPRRAPLRPRRPQARASGRRSLHRFRPRPVPHSRPRLRPQPRQNSRRLLPRRTRSRNPSPPWDSSRVLQASRQKALRPRLARPVIRPRPRARRRRATMTMLRVLRTRNWSLLRPATLPLPRRLRPTPLRSRLSALSPHRRQVPIQAHPRPWRRQALRRTRRTAPLRQLMEAQAARRRPCRNRSRWS